MTNTIQRLAGSAILAGTLALATMGTVAADTYTLDPGHTEVRFEYLHLGIST